MDLKPQPNHRQYIQALRHMGPDARLQKAFELSEFTKQLFIQGLRDRFPERNEQEIHQLMLERLAKCHNSNY